MQWGITVLCRKLDKVTEWFLAFYICSCFSDCITIDIKFFQGYQPSVHIIIIVCFHCSEKTMLVHCSHKKIRTLVASFQNQNIINRHKFQWTLASFFICRLSGKIIFCFLQYSSRQNLINQQVICYPKSQNWGW